MMLILFLFGLLATSGCQTSQPQSTPTPRAEATPVQAPKKSSAFTVEVAKGPTKPVDIWLEGPTKEKRTVEPNELSQTFELTEGVYELTVRSEGFRNFALKIQIPENDSVKAVLTPLPQGDVSKTPVDDPFKR
jgi:hypothetical protein